MLLSIERQAPHPTTRFADSKANTPLFVDGAAASTNVTKASSSAADLPSIFHPAEAEGLLSDSYIFTSQGDHNPSYIDLDIDNIQQQDDRSFFGNDSYIIHPKLENRYDPFLFEATFSIDNGVIPRLDLPLSLSDDAPSLLDDYSDAESSSATTTITPESGNTEKKGETESLLGREACKALVRGTDGQFGCPYPRCRFRSNRKYNLSTHYDVTHLSIYPFVCDGCQKAFSRKFDKERHFLITHTEKKPLKLRNGSAGTVKRRFNDVDVDFIMPDSSGGKRVTRSATRYKPF
ncbi:hypothetical protein SeLEV6574_g03312 [Synchytrium endobioticum]|uniref:C2H2-type domain-containing protein n=1 Tax=Synchytrium endobioticum TaxID=286115 RepID=A0A507D446_9FUNG|nr:hypothetical protein SeLEV6574_g03312 [Synchytrium endobioticum]